MVHISLINKENMPRNVSGRLTSRLLCEQYATRGKIIWKTQHVQLLWRVSRSIFERNVTTQLCWGRWQKTSYNGAQIALVVSRWFSWFSLWIQNPIIM